MKNLLLLLSFIFVFGTAFSQITIADEEGNALEDGQTYTIPVPDELMELGYLITNSSDSEITYIIEAVDWTIGAPFGVCGGGTCSDLTLLSPPANIGSPSSLDAGATTTAAMTHVQALVGVAEGNFVTVHVYEEGNPSNSVTFTFEAGVVGINDNININDNFISAYPNPATNYVNFSYNYKSNENAYIVITNVLGKEFKKINITNNKGIQKVGINNLKSGIYFYTLFVDNKAIISKKLIIAN